MFFPLTALADDVIYDKELGDNEDYFFMRGVSTKDGGYAALAVENTFNDSGGNNSGPKKTAKSSNELEPSPSDSEDNTNYLYIIKYSKNGEQQWVNRYSMPDEPWGCNEYSGLSSVCRNFQEAEFLGFAELDNGNLMVVSNYFRLLISDTGTLISTLSMDSKFYNYVGFRCNSEGEGTACVAIGENGVNSESDNTEKLLGMIFTINEDGSIGKTFQIPCLQVVISEDAPSVGVPVSFFKNNDDNYVMETVEGIIPWLYILDGNLNRISKVPVLIRNSSINIIQQVGDIYWITGQYSNNDYFGAYIKYAGPYAMSKTSYVTYNPEINNVLQEKVISEALIDINNEISDDTKAILIKNMALGVLGLLDGFRDGKYVSAFDINFAYREAVNSNERSTVNYDFNFIRMDSTLDEIYNYQLASGQTQNDDVLLGGLFTSVLRLTDGADVILTNVGRDGGIRGRHVKIAKKNTVSAVIENKDDVTFEKSVYEPGDVVKIQLKQKDGYYVDKVIVRDENGNEIEYDKKNQTFIMPDSDVTVEVQYREIKQVKTGIFLTTILSLLAIGTVSFSTFRYFKKQKPIGM